VDVRTQEDPTAAVLARLEAEDLADSVLRIRVPLRADQQALLREREIEAAASEASHVSISQEVESEVRARLGNLSPEALTPIELVEKYFQSRGQPPARIVELLGKAEEMLRDPH
jgi:hypothetical protein